MQDKQLQTILYVEDDPDIQVIGVLALEQVGGLNVIVANSGFEALELAEQHIPDLILLDVMMPQMDGITTIKKLRENEQTQTIPVFFMTAKVQEYEIQHYYQLGAAAVIAKPFDPMTLAAQIREKWQQLND